MRESQFQRELIKRLEQEFPGCMVLKNDAQLRQGIPDLLILYRRRWAALEVKPHRDAPHQPNQEWYVEHMDDMSYAATIFPENEEDILNALQHALKA